MMILGKILFCDSKASVTRHVLPLQLEMDKTKKKLNLKKRKLSLNIKVQRENS